MGLIKLKEAIHELYAYDRRNIMMDVSERNLCARLAHYLEILMREHDRVSSTKVFTDYYADVEYNRMEDRDGKPIKKEVVYDNNSHSIVSDLLVHSRDAKHNNLLALEMKKKDHMHNAEKDILRLTSFVMPHDEKLPQKYVSDTLLGVFLVIGGDGCLLNTYEFDKQTNQVLENSIPIQVSR